MSETSLTMIFFIIKFIVLVGATYYFQRIGIKIDNPSIVTTSWAVFWIPLYLFQAALFLLIILESFAMEANCCDSLKLFISSLIYFLGFLFSSILLPIKLDGLLTDMNFFVIPGLVTFSSVYLIIHRTCVANK